MPDVAGRRRAVFVALTIAAIVLSVIPFAAHSATAPPGINRFLYALGQVESGGSYTARNPSSGAYGKYQILPSNWPAWAKLYVGSSTAPWTPLNQETVARGKVTALWNWLDTWPNVAHWWLTGSGDTNRAHWSSYSTYYVAKLMKIYGRRVRRDRRRGRHGSPAEASGRQSGHVRTTTAATTTRRIGETQRRDRLRRPLARRALQRLRRQARSSTRRRAGATATYPFYGKSVAWIGPVGPTRGKAQVAIDGKARRDGRPPTEPVQARVTLFEPLVEARRRPHDHDHGRRQRPAGRDRRVRHHPVTAAPAVA